MSLLCCITTNISVAHCTNYPETEKGLYCNCVMKQRLFWHVTLHKLCIINVPFKNTTQSRLITLIGVVFSNGAMLSVSDKYDSANKRTQEISKSTKITYSRGVAKCP